MPLLPLVLIVEDDPVLRELYRVVLSSEGFEVHACKDGLAALQYLDQVRPDLIVLDLGLPHVPGTDIYQEIRAHAETHEVPIVICTGLDVVAEFPDATVLRKPCPPDQLISAVRAGFQRTRLSAPDRRRAWASGESERLTREMCTACQHAGQVFVATNQRTIPGRQLNWRCGDCGHAWVERDRRQSSVAIL